MGRYLIVAHQTAGSPELRRHVATIVGNDPDARFSVLVPATPVQHLFTWEEGETLAIARRNANEAAELLRDAGANVTRVTIGGRVPMPAIEDELRLEGGYTGIVICTFPPGASRWLKLDLVNQARRKTGLPVTHVTAAVRERSAVARGGRK